VRIYLSMHFHLEQLVLSACFENHILLLRRPMILWSP
jgi:hypothetical protein